jgi:lysophospholipase L1-like esterase
VAVPSSTNAPAGVPRRPRRARRFLAIALGLLVAVAGVEVALRVLTAWANPPLYELDERVGWRHAANVDRELTVEGGRRVRFATDARGLRATPHADARTPGRARLLVAGDSFTQGSQVEQDELFTVRLERALDATEVWNAGVGGWSTVQQLLALPAQLAAYAPDAVVLVVFENDFQDNLMPYFAGLGPRPHVRLRAGDVELVERPDPAPFTRFLLPAPGAWWLYRHSALYRTLHKNVFVPARGDALALLERTEREALPVADQRTAMAWALARVAARVRESGPALLVAAIPLREHVESGDDGSQRWLAAQCERLGVPFLSLLPALRAEGTATAYFREDIHLTASGHAAVARAFAPRVAELLRAPR